MNNELIKVGTVKIGEGEVNAVNARSIYEYLEVKTRYNAWIQRAIDKYNFKENIDFIRSQEVLPKNGQNLNQGGRPISKHIITLNMAKQLAMVSNTDKGQEIRNYFIDIEQKYIAKKQKEINYYKSAKKYIIGNLDINEFKADTAIDIIKRYKATKNEIKTAVIDAIDNKTTEQYKTLLTLFIDSIKTQTNERLLKKQREEDAVREKKEAEIKEYVSSFVNNLRSKIKRLDLNITDFFTDREDFKKKLEYNKNQMLQIPNINKDDLKYDVDTDKINMMIKGNADTEKIANFILSEIKSKEIVKKDMKC